jgi:CheY-like chemotaxis protein
MAHTGTILLVEDDESMLYGIRDLLEVGDLGYQLNVLTAVNGREALALLETHTPDIIVSDIMMPLMDGLRLLTEVRKRPELADIPFIFLTARGERHEIQQGRLSGAALYITKPFQTLELLELIKTQLDRKLELEHTRKQHINTLKKGVLQILNHEFRTPLTYVTAYYEMLADSVNKYADTDNFQEYLRGIRAGCVRLNRLVDSFIAVLELRSGEAQRRFEQNARLIVDLDDLLLEVIENNRAQAELSQLRIEYRPAAELPPVWGDPKSLQVIFQHLLENAIKFSSRRFVRRPGTAVTIETAVVADELTISFHDDGVGLPTYMQNRVFDLFVQYNRDQLEQQGAGAGLPIAKGLVQLHGGRLELESEENVGSTFRVVLPVGEDRLAALPHSQRDKRATILLVEDEHFLLEGLHELLVISDIPYELHILTANNGQVGLRRMAEQTPDLIISDIMMPVMDGYTFLREVRTNPYWLQIPFIFLTAKEEPADVHMGLRSGVEEYVTKPYDSDELMGLVIKQLDRSHQMKLAMSRSFDDLKRGIIELITPDFQVPLASVTKYSSELDQQISETRTDEELKTSLEGIQSSSIRLSRLIEDFISLAELKTGEAETAYSLRVCEMADVSHLLVEAGQLAGEAAMAKGLAIVYEAQNNLPSLTGDRVMLLDCLNRLLEIGLSYDLPQTSNAIVLSSTLNGNEVWLSLRFPYTLPVRERASLLVFMNQDRFMAGVGDEAVIQPQAQTEQSPALSIVQGYMELHNGRLHLSHLADSFTFNLILPTTQ